MSDPWPLKQVLAVLAEHAESADAECAWPRASWEALCRGRVVGWMIPREYGGEGWGRLALLEGYGQLAGACLTTAFILSQRDAACRRLLASSNSTSSLEVRQELLPLLARGERFITVGLSQLSTSRQHVKPVLTARFVGEHIHLDGLMPWVTGAPQADYYLTGATMEDGRSVLVVVPHSTAGVEVGTPAEVMALQGSMTAEVRCHDVILDRRWLLSGPTEPSTAAGRNPGGLETSGLALGLATAATEYLLAEANHRKEWSEVAEQCLRTRERLQEQMKQLGEDTSSSAPTGSSPQPAHLRAQANALVLRTTQLALAAAKGAGFLRSHPAQRWARQALFFLVWSCPRPALEGTLEFLQPPSEESTECP